MESISDRFIPVNVRSANGFGKEWNCSFLLPSDMANDIAT
jgi:hypothetical protein